MASTSSVRMDWRIGPAEPTARPIPPPQERPTTLIPAERYTSDEFARREFESVFMHCWHLVGRDQDFPDLGDYLEFELGDQSILVVRVEEDLVKAFYNVCLHRGMQLRKGCGSATELRCGYHSWCWNLDGSIKEVLDPYEYHPSLGRCTSSCSRPSRARCTRRSVGRTCIMSATGSTTSAGPSGKRRGRDGPWR